MFCISMNRIDSDGAKKKKGWRGDSDEVPLIEELIARDAEWGEVA